jgi:hypothetical protein
MIKTLLRFFVDIFAMEIYNIQFLFGGKFLGDIGNYF